jgi:hypothetical protein
MVDATTPAEFAAMYSKAVRTAADDGDVIVLTREFGENLFASAGAAIINSALEYAAARHVTVVTTGNNAVVLNGVTITGYQAGPGWDPVTGWGNRDAQVLIPLLARDAQANG